MKAKKRLLGLLVEVGFILFLFYSNLLMGEYTHSHAGQRKGFLWALEDVFTRDNLVIGVVAALIGYVGFELLRKLL